MGRIKIKKVAYIILVLIIISFQPVYIWAATTSELKNKQNDIQEKIDEANTEITGIQKQKSTAMNQISNLIEEENKYKDELEELEEKLSTLNVAIEEKQKSIEERQDKFDENQELLKKRLVALYESGNTTYLDVLLNSNGLADFISKYYMISQLAEYDTKLLKQIQKEKEELESQKAELDTQKTEVVTTKENIETKNNAIKTLVNEKNSLVKNLTSEEKELKQQLEELEEDKREIANELARIAANSKITQPVITSNPSASGYIFPVAGCSKANIANKSFPSYKGHTGIDVNINVNGKPVVAVKAGTVSISKALVNKNGSYRSYGEYVAIDHHDGTITLYAHMQAGSRKVVAGQEVKQGQVIGNVGSTGNSTGPHLHFEVRCGKGYANPLLYLP